MESNSILHYLQIIKDLETMLYTQNRLAKNIQKRDSQLGKRKDFSSVKTTVEPSTEYKVKYEAKYYKIGFVLFYIFFIFCMICTILTGDTRNSVGLLIAILILFLLGGAISSALLAFLPRAIGGSIGHAKDVEIAKGRSLDKSAELMALTIKDSERVEREKTMKKRLGTELDEIKRQQIETKQVLESAYSLNIIHPKYRNLVAVTSFCEYLETGRCSQLEGHEGAYNIYEQEVRLDRIITKLDVVISKLEEIKNNQYMLYQSISQANNTLRRIDEANYKMLCSLDTIHENSELIEYNTRCANSRAEAIADMIVIQQLFK